MTTISGILSGLRPGGIKSGMAVYWDAGDRVCLGKNVFVLRRKRDDDVVSICCMEVEGVEREVTRERTSERTKAEE